MQLLLIYIYKYKEKAEGMKQAQKDTTWEPTAVAPGIKDIKKWMPTRPTWKSLQLQLQDPPSQNLAGNLAIALATASV